MTSTIDVEDVISKLNVVEKVSLLAGMLIMGPCEISANLSTGADWWHTGRSFQMHIRWLEALKAVTYAMLSSCQDVGSKIKFPISDDLVLNTEAFI